MTPQDHSQDRRTIFGLACGKETGRTTIATVSICRVQLCPPPIISLTFSKGYGKKTEKEGDEIIGVWKENRLNGFARLTVSSGGVFTGTYTEGQRHGCGIFEWPDGKLSFREYRRDLLVESAPALSLSSCIWVHFSFCLARQIDSIPAYITEAVKTIEAGYAEITSRILNRGAGR